MRLLSDLVFAFPVITCAMITGSLVASSSAAQAAPRSNPFEIDLAAMKISAKTRDGVPIQGLRIYAYVDGPMFYHHGFRTDHWCLVYPSTCVPSTSPVTDLAVLHTSSGIVRGGFDLDTDEGGFVVTPPAKAYPAIHAERGRLVSWKMDLNIGVTAKVMTFIYSSPTHVEPTQYTCATAQESYSCSQAHGKAEIEALTQAGATCVYSGTAAELEAQVQSDLDKCRIAVSNYEAYWKTPYLQSVTDHGVKPIYPWESENYKR